MERRLVLKTRSRQRVGFEPSAIRQKVSIKALTKQRLYKYTYGHLLMQCEELMNTITQDEQAYQLDDEHLKNVNDMRAVIHALKLNTRVLRTRATDTLKTLETIQDNLPSISRQVIEKGI